MTGSPLLTEHARPNQGRVTVSEDDTTVSHRGSHLELLTRMETSSITSSEDLDAVIVPTARPTDCLREAARLARDLACPLVALCSNSASADDAATVGREVGTDVVAIDVRAGDVPLFRTSRLMAEKRYEEFARTSDLSLKRNLGLMLARVAGWKRVLFLDDDISQARASDVQAAASLLADYHAVGLFNIGFPDNSVVCHAYREVGEEQDTFIGGGAMLVAPHESNSFFPDIYNEDWFFLHGEAGRRQLAITGRMWHRKFDPYADKDRARAEEFGDCLAEGLYELLHTHRSRSDASNPSFWIDAIASRRRLIRGVLDRLRQGTIDDQRKRMIASLEEAESVSSSITPKLCLDYVNAWEKDLADWQRYLDCLPAGIDIEKGLVELGLTGRSVISS